MGIYVEYSGKIFDTDLSAVAATCIHWRLPGLGSRVAVTVVFCVHGIEFLVSACENPVIDSSRLPYNDFFVNGPACGF